MQVARISLNDSSDVSPLKSWLSEHPDITIMWVAVSGPHFYIFYR